jgi:AcrR family transcriptional regulator
VTSGARVRRPAHGPGSLLDVAAGEFLARGYDATSMEDLSRAAGITKSSFYHHYAGKEALLRAALERALDGLFALLDTDGARAGTPLERLRHIVRGQVEVLLAELPYVTLLLRVRGNTESERWALERRRAFDARIAALVREAVDAGELRAGVDPALAARLLSGLVNSVVDWARPGRAAGDLPDQVVRAAFEGILPS